MEQINISKEDLAYIAGLFDGEGCVALSCYKPKVGPYVLSGSLIITNTNVEVLQWCLKTFSKGHLVLNQCPSRLNKGHKPCYRFILEQAEARSIGPLILPFLKIKNEQLELFLSFFNSRKQRTINSSYSLAELGYFFECKRLLQENKDFILLGKKKYSKSEFCEMIFTTRAKSCYSVFEWSNESISLLGTDTDDVIALKLNVKRHVIQKKRKALKIKPFKSFRDQSYYR